MTKTKLFEFNLLEFWFYCAEVYTGEVLPDVSTLSKEQKQKFLGIVKNFKNRQKSLSWEYKWSDRSIKQLILFSMFVLAPNEEDTDKYLTISGCMYSVFKYRDWLSNNNISSPDQAEEMLYKFFELAK